MCVLNQPVKVCLPSAGVVPPQKPAGLRLFKQPPEILQPFPLPEPGPDGAFASFGDRLASGEIGAGIVVQLLYLAVGDFGGGGPSVRTGWGRTFKLLFIFRQRQLILRDGLRGFSLFFFLSLSLCICLCICLCIYLCISIFLFISLYI